MGGSVDDVDGGAHRLESSVDEVGLRSDLDDSVQGQRSGTRERDPTAASSEVGALGVLHLRRLWAKAIAAREGRSAHVDEEAEIDRLVLDGLGIGLHQAMEYLFRASPSFDEFEAWIVAIAGEPEPHRVDRLNAEVAALPYPDEVARWLDEVERSAPVLSDDDLAHWDEHGFVVVPDAVSADDRHAAELAIWEHVGAVADDPTTWYPSSRSGIMVELIQHRALEANRRSARVHKAFAQLWDTADLWTSADRCGFHAPQRAGQPFAGPDLHWDIDLTAAPEFGTQGILYLTDTPPDQGALTLVPGFHHRLERWLRTLDGGDPHAVDLHALGSQPVGGSAGALVIWHQSLPHGSSPNSGNRPRIVQYINMYPGPSRRSRS